MLPIGKQNVLGDSSPQRLKETSPSEGPMLQKEEKNKPSGTICLYQWLFSQVGMHYTDDVQDNAGRSRVK